MNVEIVDAVIEEGNDDAPLTYKVDGQLKQIGWSALNDLFEQRYAEQDQHHSQEQRLLAQIVQEHWVDSDDWWQGASASSEDAPA